jgi:hypothetical protein
VKRHQSDHGPAHGPDQVAAGNLIRAIGEPTAPDVKRVLFALFLGLEPVSDTEEGSLLLSAGTIA